MEKRGAILSHAVLQKLVEYVSLSMRIGKKLDNEEVNCSLQVFSGSSPSVCCGDFAFDPVDGEPRAPILPSLTFWHKWYLSQNRILHLQSQECDHRETSGFSQLHNYKTATKFVINIF